MKNLEKFKGIFVALNTIYDENDEINVNEIQKLVKVYESKGVKGVYVCGSTGEGFLLSTEERMQVVEAVKEVASDDFTIIVHVGCAGTKESIKLAKHAEKVGVDAVSAVPSVYYHLSPASVEKHWNGIIDSTDLPFIIYNIPQLTSFNLPLDLFERMAKNPKVIGIKNSEEPVFNMERYRTVAGDDFIIFNGSDEQMLGGRLMGANAGIGGTYGSMPELYLKLNSLITENKIVEAKALQVKINDFVQRLCSFPSLYGASKAVIKLRYGIVAGIPRLPMLPVSVDDPKLVELVKDINMAVEEVKNS